MRSRVAGFGRNRSWKFHDTASEILGRQKIVRKTGNFYEILTRYLPNTYRQGNSCTNMRTALFWAITFRVVVIPNDVSGQPVSPVFKGKQSKKGFRALNHSSTILEIFSVLSCIWLQRLRKYLYRLR
jgi:hypothetical protein